MCLAQFHRAYQEICASNWQIFYKGRFVPVTSNVNNIEAQAHLNTEVLLKITACIERRVIVSENCKPIYMAKLYSMHMAIEREV